MRLVKKLKFKRVKELHIFKKLKNSFLKLKIQNQTNERNITTCEDLSKLNYFVVLEYINLINDKINYKKIFPKSDLGSNSIVDFNNLVQEQEKLKVYIQKNKNRGPVYFKNLGVINEVQGCYIVATTHKHPKKVKDLNFKNKNNNEFLFIKFDFKKLPKEFEKICFEYHMKKNQNLEKEKEEFENFLNLSNDEQDIIIENLFNDIQGPFVNEGELEKINKTPVTATTIQFAAENKINQINDLDFLFNMLQSSEDIENYELCAKIRDRIFEIKKNM